MPLFVKEHVVGVFKGFTEGGLEFHADIMIQYSKNLNKIPLHGQFILVQIETENEAILGRITSISAQGKLSGSIGEDYGIRAIQEDREIPQDLLEQYLKYQINIRVLGVLRSIGEKITFTPSHRRLPHVGSKVAFPSEELLSELAGANIASAADFGFYALGEFIYSGDDMRLEKQEWMQIQKQKIISRFPVNNLVARRSFVFARAGFGKSNLVKLLFSSLYTTQPEIEKRGKKKVPVGTLIFDTDGEYFWPDDKGRPGFCDVPHLRDQVVVFTNRDAPGQFYNSFIADTNKLDIRDLKASEVVSIALSPEKLEQQNVRKIAGLYGTKWVKAVDIIHKDGNKADSEKLKELLSLSDSQEVELNAARANLTQIVRLLHDPSSQLLRKLKKALREGKICIIDTSQQRGKTGLILTGIILQEIFNINQEEFTKAVPQSIPTIAVLEEAQSILGEGVGSDSPYVAWVKEGRKYDLGSVMITQQPGSISSELLSQGDNWFSFHLLSANDLYALKKANAHFSDDLLSSLLNEPIPGNGIMWSSAGGKSYPVPVRVLSFETMYPTIDNNYNKESIQTYASSLKNKNPMSYAVDIDTQPEAVHEPAIDYRSEKLGKILDGLRKDDAFNKKIVSRGITWKGVAVRIAEYLEGDDNEKETEAHHLVSEVMDALFPGRWKDDKRESKSKPGKMTIWLVVDAESEE